MHPKNVLHAWNKIARRAGTLLVTIIIIIIIIIRKLLGPSSLHNGYKPTVVCPYSVLLNAERKARK